MSEYTSERQDGFKTHLNASKRDRTIAYRERQTERNDTYPSVSLRNACFRPCVSENVFPVVQMPERVKSGVFVRNVIGWTRNGINKTKGAK